MSDSLRPHGQHSPLGSSAHGISPPRIPEWVAISFSKGSPKPRDRIWVFCIGRWILYLWATRESLSILHIVIKCYYLRNMLCKTIAARGSDSSDVSGQPIENPLEKTCYFRYHEEHSWFIRRGRNMNIKRSLGVVDSNSHRWLWGGSTSVEEATADVVEVPRELEWEVGPEDET